MQWEMVELGNVTINLDGKRIPLNNIERNGKRGKGSYPYIGANNIMDWIDEYIFDEKILCIAEDGGSWGSNQKCAQIYEGKCWVNNHAHVLKENGRASLEYLMYYLNHTDLTKYITGTTRGKLTKSALNQIQIPLPPLAEQQRLAALLDTADALRRHDRQLLAHYDRLVQSVFLKLFGDIQLNEKKWQVYTIEELSSEIIDCPHSTPKYSNRITKFPCIRTTELKKGGIDWTSMKYLEEDEHLKRIARLEPLPGDIVYGREGSFGEAAIIPKDTKMSLGQRVMLFRPKSERINNTFFWALLRSKAIYAQALQKTSGSTVGHVNIKDIRKFKGVCPPLSLQTHFAALVHNIEAQKERVRAQAAQSEALFQGLLQRVFAG